MSNYDVIDKKQAGFIKAFNRAVKTGIIANMEATLSSISAPEDMKEALEFLKFCDTSQVVQCQANLNGYVNSLITMFMADTYQESMEAKLRSKDFSKFSA